MGWQLENLKAAGVTARQNAEALFQALNDCSRVVTDARDWHGQTRDAALKRTDEEIDHGHEVRNLLLQFADDAADAYQDFLPAVKYVITQAAAAVADGCRIGEQGSVTHPDTNNKDKQAAAGVYQLNISSGLNEIERIDNTYGQRLREVQASLAAIRDGQPTVTFPRWPEGHLTPHQAVDRLSTLPASVVAETMAKMSPADIQQMVIADPAKMGNLNGVPFDVRIAANRLNIENALAGERAKPEKEQDKGKIDRLKGLLDPIPDPTKSKRVPNIDPITGKEKDPKTGELSTSDKKPYYNIEKADGTNPFDAAMVDRKFIAFDPNGNGRMIEMFGDLKPGVKGTGVYVPGTGTDLWGSRDNETAAWNLSQQTKGPTFLYMEGDFPHGLGKDGAMDPKYAADMAPRLVDFGKEIDREVSQHAPGTPVTYVGHSYGGSIVGTAEQLGLRADRVLHASSAGSGIYDTEWNDPNPNVKRYSMTAPGDLIHVAQDAPRRLPVEIPDNPVIPSRNPHGGLPEGTDPDRIPGVTRLDTGYYGDHNHDGKQEVIFGKDGHGNYWNDPDSTAFRNIVGVIAGTEVTGYVERGVETDYISVKPGDDGNLGEEAATAAEAAAWEQAGKKPYDNPRVTSNPNLGPTMPVR
ncbi:MULTISPECIES: alpha/beta hydrolase [unclassified Nocardia]|uniref:alpha/beta hydrolase n=1 Tax=unclassified Nocardia TaxID=2637762 RepID=UPI001CE47789|nr:MULTISPECIES: alpha/beta hydrolase [unclassified Nocardia]